MRKRWWALVALAVLLAAAIGVTLFLRRPRPAPSAGDSGRIELVTREESSLVKVRLFDRPEGTLTMEKKDGAWTVPSAPGAALDSEAAGNLAYHFWSLTVERVVDEKPSDAGQYGLAPPRARAEGTFADGSSVVLLLGDPTPGRDGYYLQVQGDTRVCIAWTVVGEHLRWRLADIRDRTLAPSITPAEVTSITVRQPGGRVIEIVQKPAGEAKSSLHGFGRFVLVRPYRVPRGADEQKLQELLAAALSVQIAEFVDDGPVDPAAYGLARPWAEAAVSDRAGTLALQFGARTPDGAKRYFRAAGRPNVYAADESSLAFLETPPFTLAEKFVLIPNIDDVDRIQVSAGGSTHTLAITRAPGPPPAAGEQEQAVETFTADGRQLEEKSFRRFYQQLIGIMVEGEARPPAGAAPEVRTRFFLRPGTGGKAAARSVEAAYLPLDRDFYAVSVDGVSEFAVSRGQVEAMQRMLDRLLAGEPLED